MEYLRGNCLYQQNKLEDALRVYTTLREKHPDSAFAARALYKSAWAQYLTGKSTEAREAVKAFLDKYADSELHGDALYLLALSM